MSQTTQSSIDPDINFRQIKPRNGSQHDSFEELCCQLARRTADVHFQRLHGPGGDGGVEGYVDTSEGRCGWQAKYVFDVSKLIKQADKSLTTALSVHENLTRFVLCFPFDLTGPTARKGRSGTEKLNDWKRKREEAAHSEGRNLTIEVWSASHLQDLLVEHDVSGGVRIYFFGTPSLSDHWFAEHLQKVIATAGPRYTPELNVETDLYQWMAAFGREPSWVSIVKSKLCPIREAEKSIGLVLHHPYQKSEFSPTWPEDSLATTNALVDQLQSVLGILEDPEALSIDSFNSVVAEVSASVEELRKVESILYQDLVHRHGKDRANSPDWHQAVAEQIAHYPADHLEKVRKLLAESHDLKEWLNSPACNLAFRHHFILAGEAGSGKTHGVCDAAKRRQQAGRRTCVVFGHEFGSEPHPWTRVAETLGLPQTLGADQLLDCLNAAGEASRFPLLICIDAINETKPLSYWKNHAAALAQSVHQRRHLRLCLVCKSTYVSQCIPDGEDYLVINHRGFEGIERQACKLYFEHYGLRPPIAPILQPELANPLYLHLVCEWLKGAKRNRLPPGWSDGGTEIFREFLRQKALQFSLAFENSQPNASTKCLMQMVNAMAASGNPSLSRPEAKAAIESEVEDGHAALTWLVKESLLIEEPVSTNGFDEETSLRPAFERLGDFLIAWKVLDRIPTGDLIEAAHPEGTLRSWLQDLHSIQTNWGILAEFAVLAAERDLGFELTDFARDPETQDALAAIVMQSLVFRNADSLTDSTTKLIQEALNPQALNRDAMDAVVSCGWRPSNVDAIWLHGYFEGFTMHARDAFWCRYLHESLESEGVVANLISAVDELSLKSIEPDIAERWVILLLWFTAASDRRVKNRASRAATAILISVTSNIPKVIARFIRVNDDSVRERVLLCCYGALLVSRDSEVARDVAASLFRAYMDTPSDFDNALIRDHIRCFCEFSLELSNDAPRSIDPEAITNLSASSNWPLEIPEDIQVEEWAESLRFRPDEFHSDFFKYTMTCLRPWMHTLSKLDMGKWIAQRVARDFSFCGSDCEYYDRLMLNKYGGGRSKPVWAERIAKKYAWIALSQLSSRLNDHAERRLESWEKHLVRTPLILPERRELDLTKFSWTERELSPKHDWSIPKPKELSCETTSNFESWLRERNMPTLEDIARPTSLDDRQFRPIMAYLDWEGVERGLESGAHYRYIWANLQSYLVPSDQIKRLCLYLRGQNLFGLSLPQPLSLFNGFVAEYPWGTVFQSSQAKELGDFAHLVSGEIPVSLIPAWSEVVSEWEYDESRRNKSVRVPATQLLDRGSWWNHHHGGFATANGDLVFIDPFYRNIGPPALLAEVNYLNRWLKSEGLAIFLTLMGQKHLRTSDFDRSLTSPSCTISQIGFLDGTTQQFSKPFLSIQ